uniref:Putative salivary lipocalin n=1 Tax=Ixodes ricinus TaxID=34613 RepID=A0A0K8RMC3_IXORI
MSQSTALSSLLFFALASSVMGSLRGPGTVVKVMEGHKSPFYFNVNASESQNMSKVIFTGERTYITYRSYLTDPLFGNNGDCPYLIPKNPEGPAASSILLVLGYKVKSSGEEVNMTRHADLITYAQYPAPNILSIKKAERNREVDRSYTLVFSDYSNCSVVRSSYMNGGCEIWAPTSTAGQEPTPCCLFLYEILCGKMKFQMYDADKCSIPIPTEAPEPVEVFIQEDE